MKKIIGLFLGLMGIAFFSFAVSPAIGMNPFIMGGGLVALFLIPTAEGVLMTSIKITDLTTALGAYSRANKDILISEMLLTDNIRDRFDVMDGIKDEVALPSLAVADLVKPATPETFTPTADALSFGARIGKVRPWSVDLVLVPTVLEKTWLGQYYDKGSLNFEVPFEQFIMNYIVQKVQENLRMKAIYSGVYNAVGTTPGAVMNGLLTLTTAEVAAGVVPVVTGIINATNVLDKLEMTYDALGEAYKEMESEMIVNPTIFDWAVRRNRALYNASNIYDGVAKNEFTIEGTNCKVKREAGLGTSQRLICTPKSNKIFMCDSLSDDSNIIIQPFNRTLKVMIDGKAGVDFGQVHARALAVNDQV
jgi:hypothetical protein